MRHLAQEDDDLQDWLSGYWPALFLNKPDSVLPALIALCEDSEIGEYMLGSVQSALINVDTHGVVGGL